MTGDLVGYDAHNDLLDHLEALDQWWPDPAKSRVSTINAREVIVQLTELRGLLREHFVAEEDRGLLPNEQGTDPRLLRDAEQLLQQHGVLLDRLNALIASVPLISEGPSAWTTTKAEFDEFRKQIEAHEHAEIELLQSCDDEVGVVD